MTLSKKILLGLTLGIAAGLFLGEYAAWLKPVADGYVKLLQMTVLPYIMVSLLSKLGVLSYTEVRTLAVRAGSMLLLLWGLTLVIVFLFPLMFPTIQTASFFSTTLLDPPEKFDPVKLFIPANPFFSLANNVVPAVVLFSVAVGIALITVPGKESVLNWLNVVRNALSGVTSSMVRLTPYGLFAIGASAAGTLSVEQIARLQVYLISYVAMALLVALWLLPGLISALTTIPYIKVLSVTRDTLITAFMTDELFIVLPMLTEQTKTLAREHGLEEEQANTPDVIVPTSFTFPHTGKLLTLSFILFAGWFADAGLRLAEYAQLAAAGILVFFGSLNVAVPFLLDLFRIPADTFQLFLASGVINSRFGTLMATMHTISMALLGTWAMAGALRVERRRMLRYATISVALTAIVIGGVRATTSWLVAAEYQGDKVITGMRLLQERGPAIVHREAPPAPDATALKPPVLDRIRQRGTLRVGYFLDSLPFAYFNSAGDLVGFDVEMAHKLARELGARPEFVPVDRQAIAAALAQGTCDLVMSGIVVTTERAANMLFSSVYLDETLAFGVADHRREQFTSWGSVSFPPLFGQFLA
jgi:Na+/H+-dicarboxylate symporter